MTPLLTIVEGWTEQLGPFTLLNDGAPLVLDGLTVSVILRSLAAGSSSKAGAGVVTKLDQALYPGQVTYAPAATDFTMSETLVLEQPYLLHWKVIDADGKIAYWPNGLGDEILVCRA